MGAPSGSSEPGKPLAAGPAIAATLDFAAGLAELTAGVSGDEGLEERARALRAAVVPLGAQDAEAYAAFLRGDPGAREQTIEIPARLAELAAAIAAVAADATERASTRLGGDSITGALLAEAAARAAFELVSINVERTDDERVSAAAASARRAAEAAARALAKG